MNRFEYAAPESVAEVLGLLEDRWDTRVLAGGTDLIHEIRHGIESPSRAANLLVTAKRMFSRHLHAVVRETVANPAQAEAELRELKQCL